MKPTNRRQFIQQTSLLSAAFFISKGEYFKLNKNVGVQLYTVRDLTPKDYEGTVAKVAEIGYKEVEAATDYAEDR